MNISQFLEKLDGLEESVDLHQLKNWMSQLDFDAQAVNELARFDAVKYQRNLVRRSDRYEALLLCFEAGQRTPVHDHAGSACGVKVLQGTGTETVFQSTDEGWLYATGSTQLPTGGVVGSNDMDIHQLSNLQGDGQRLVTLHVYSPPLGEVGNYDINTNQRESVRAPIAVAKTSAAAY